MNTILVDGDVIAYQVTTSVETAIDWGDDMWTLHADFKEAKNKVDISLSNLMDTLDGVEMFITLSGSKNFRKEILPTYKSHRKKTRKPVIYPEIKQYMRDTYKVYEFDRLEGDDVLGLLATGSKKLKADPVVVSIDKDLKTIPGQYYNPDKPEEGIKKITVEEADYNHLYQTLMGDTTDGYSGCPGIGPKSAAKLLDEDCSWDTVMKAYNKKGISEEEALIQAQVARILRHKEFNLKTKEINLWKPTSK